MIRIKYGIIGAGMMGREHIQNINLLDTATVIAISEPNKEQQAISHAMSPQARVYTSHKDIIKDTDIDAFVIASPNYTHTEILLDICQTDTRPVLIEKPLCTTFDDCKKLLDITAKYTAPIWVAMEYRYMEAVKELIEQVTQGIVGNKKMVTVREHRFPFLKKVGDWNRFNRNTGGTLVEKCCHFFDLMCLLMEDEVIRVYASGSADVNFLDETYDGNVPDIIDNAYVILDFKSGKRGMLDLCMFCDGSYYQERIAVLGDKGKLECKIPGPDRLWAVNDLNDIGDLTGFNGEHRSSEIVFSPRNPKGPIHKEIKANAVLQSAGDHLGATFYQHQNFNAVIRGEGEVEVSVEDGVKSVMIGIAAEKSIANHQAIEIKDIGI